MTRNYDKQRRDNMRPSSRYQPSSRPGDNRSPRSGPARPHRESMDRAWESGAPNRHADYHVRDNNSTYGQPSRNNRRYNQSSEHSSFRDNHRSRPYEQRSQFRARDENQRRGYQRRNSEQYDRRPRDFDRDDRSPRDFDRQPRDFEHNNRSPRPYKGGNHPSYRAQRPDTPNPRRQSRPGEKRDTSFRGQERFNDRTSQGEQFEGDYERFDRPEYPRRPQHPSTSRRPFQDRNTRDKFRPQTEERRVTQLPDGRVLKGPRTVQRRNAQFWTDVSHESEDLLGDIDSTPAKKRAEHVKQAKSAEKKDTPEAPRKQHTASAIVRGKKAGKKSPAKPYSSGPKPSRRGFKWPAP